MVTKTFFVMIVLNMSGEQMDVHTMRFETFKECFTQQMIIEKSTDAFAKCKEFEERID